MEAKLFPEENKQWEREYLSGFELDVELFERLKLKIVQIVPDRNSFRLETDKGFFSLKKLRFPEEEMNFALDCLDLLKNNSFLKVLDIVDLPGGKLYMDYKGSRYYLTKWVDGRECDYLNGNDMVKGSELLALFHAAAKGCDQIKAPKRRNLLGKWPELFMNLIDEMYAVKHIALGRKSRGPIDGIFAGYAERCISNAEKALDMLQKSRYPDIADKTGNDGGFTHHDLLHNSLVYTFSGDIYIIDFEPFVMDIRMHDLGSFILRCMKRGEWDIATARLIIESYDKINPLRKDELSVLMPFLLFPQEFWSMARQYLAPDKEYDEQELMEKLDPDSDSSEKRSCFIEQLRKII